MSHDTLGMEAHTRDPSTWEIKKEGSEFEADQHYNTRPCFFLFFRFLFSRSQQHLQWLEAGRQVLTIGPGLESCHTIREGFIAT